MQKKIKLALVLALMLAAMIAIGITVSAEEVRSGTVTGSVVNIRSTPSTNGNWVASLSKGCKVIIHEQVNDWFKVSYYGNTGFMAADYVVPQCDEDTPYGYGVATGSFVYIRAAASTDSIARGTISEGVNVQITGVKDGWYEVKYGDITGYMSPDYVQPIKVKTTATVAQVTITEGQKIVNIAKKYLGIKYVWGGSTPSTGFDCSGFTQYVYKEYGITIRVRTQQYLDGTSVKYSELQPGDLVFFDTKRNGTIAHVGIYIGGGQFIHAPTYGKPVQITSIASGFYRNTFVCARRLVGD